MGQAHSKVEGATIAGAGSALAVTGGIALMFAGPVGWFVGGCLIGAGITSGVNIVDQCMDEKKGDTFDYTACVKHAGIGAAGGAIAAGVGGAVIGGAAVAGVTSASATFATGVAAGVVGGAASGGCTNVLTKVVNGEKATKGDFLKGALVGGAAGAVGAVIGQGAQMAASSLSKGVTKATETCIKVGAGVVGGGLGGAAGGAIGKLIENKIYQGELTEITFMKIMKDADMDFDDVKMLWTFLCDNGIIVAEVVKKQVPASLEFPRDLKYCENLVREVIEKVYTASVTKGVGNAAVSGLIIGGVMGGISAGADIHQKNRQARQNERTGTDSATEKNSLGAGERRGRLLGGGNGGPRRVTMTAGNKQKAIDAVVKHNPAMECDARSALNSLEGMSTKQLGQMKHNLGVSGSANKGPHNIHALGRDLTGLVAVDLKRYGQNQSRCAGRLLFRTTHSSKLEFHDFIPTHDYAQIKQTWTPPKRP